MIHAWILGKNDSLSVDSISKANVLLDTEAIELVSFSFL